MAGGKVVALQPIRCLCEMRHQNRIASRPHQRKGRPRNIQLRAVHKEAQSRPQGGLFVPLREAERATVSVVGAPRFELGTSSVSGRRHNH